MNLNCLIFKLPHLQRMLGLLITALVLLLSGCAAMTGPEKYPADWAPLVGAATADGCPNLTGKYSAHATAVFPDVPGATRTLGEVFDQLGSGNGLFSPREYKVTWPLVSEAESVVVEQSPELITFHFMFKDDRPEEKLVFRRYHFNWFEKRYDDLFHCYPSESGSRLRFFAEPAGPIYLGGLPYIYGSWKGGLIFLLRAQDGSLVAQYRTETIFITGVLLGTHVDLNSIWWRYPALGQ